MHIQETDVLPLVDGSSSRENEQLKYIVKLLGAELKAARDNKELLKKENTRLQEELREKETRFVQANDTLMKERRLFEEENIQLKNQKKDQTGSEEQRALLLHRENSSLKQHVEALQTELNESKKKQLELNREKELNDLGPQLTRLAQQLSKTQEEIHSLTCERAVLIRTYKDAQEELQKALTEKEHLHAQLTQYESEGQTVKNENDGHKQTIQALQTHCTSLEKELEKETSSLTLLKTQYEDIERSLQQTVQENEAVHTHFKETEDLLVMKLGQIAELEEELQSTKNSLLTFQENNSSLELKQKELEAELKKEKETSYAHMERINTLLQEIDVLKQKLNSASSQLMLLQGWKRKLEQPFAHMQEAFAEFLEQEKHKDQQNIPQQTQFFTARQAPYDSLF